MRRAKIDPTFKWRRPEFSSPSHLRCHWLVSHERSYFAWSFFALICLIVCIVVVLVNELYSLEFVTLGKHGHIYTYRPARSSGAKNKVYVAGVRWRRLSGIMSGHWWETSNQQVYSFCSCYSFCIYTRNHYVGWYIWPSLSPRWKPMDWYTVTESDLCLPLLALKT